MLADDNGYENLTINNLNGFKRCNLLFVVEK